jgi:hypothetical protein
MLKASAASNGDVYVSIIPFSRDVNVGGTNYSATWIDWTDWDKQNGSYASLLTGPTFADAGEYLNWDGTWPAPEESIIFASNNGNNGNGNGNGGGGSTPKTWVPNSHSTWNGCITDRGGSLAPSSQNYDTNVSPPVVGTAASLFPAEQYNACPVQMMGLNYDWTAMNTLVNQMTPNGNTNQAIGLSWAWLSLVGGGPLTAPAKDANYKYNDVIILLTDGLNTQNRWYSDQASIDAREEMTCANIKAAGITLYTVQVNTGGDATSTLLQQCASDSNKFFLLTTASSIVTTFNQIGTQLSKLRVAK